jgi:ATP-dependent Zn protease
MHDHVNQILLDAQDRVTDILTEHHELLGAVAAALLEDDTLNAGEIQAIKAAHILAA